MRDENQVAEERHGQFQPALEQNVRQEHQENNHNALVGGNNFPAQRGAGRRNNMQQGGGEHELDYNEDGVIEGGVAAAPVAPSVAHYFGDDTNIGSNAANIRRSVDCDLVLFLECAEDLQTAPNAIAKCGATISIGLDKTTKLNALFNRFVEFIKEKSPDKESLPVSDLEFVHNEILIGKDTAESAALMKDDRIKVRKQRRHLRDEKMERQLKQRDSDRLYFQSLRTLLTDLSKSDYCAFDVVFDCRGTFADEKPPAERSAFIQAHSAIVARRCSWLATKIRLARAEQKIKKSHCIPSDDLELFHKIEISTNSVSRTVSHTIENLCPTDIVEPTTSSVNVSSTSARMAIADDDVDCKSIRVECIDDDDAVLPNPLIQPTAEKVSPGTAEVIIEEDDDSVVEAVSHHPITEKKYFNNSKSYQTQVTLIDHHPEAMKLLLEYCYTNRIISLGHDAFSKASEGAVSPFSGPSEPTVSMSLALAAIKLAGDAGISRFSLMCEIAASNLVTKFNVLKVLSFCYAEDNRSGNKLPLLRKSAVSLLLQKPIISELSTASHFATTLNRERDAVVPSLLVGTKDIICVAQKRKRPSSNKEFLERLDVEDKVARNIERHFHSEKRSKTTFAEDSLSHLGSTHTYQKQNNFKSPILK